MSEYISLAETAKFIVDNRGKTVPTSDSGIPLIKTNCISNDAIYPEIDGQFYISEETYNSWFRAHPEPNDIIITLKGSQNGAVCLVPDPVSFAIAQDMVAIRVDEKKINKFYLLAALRSREVQHAIKTLDVSGVIPHLKKSDFDKLLIKNIDRKSQDYMGELYFNLSKKISRLSQQNQTLEELAQTLFKRWFVDFEFPDEKGQPYKSSGGKMIDSELREIPEGWNIQPLSSIATFLNGLACQKFPPKNDFKNLPVLKIKELGSGISENTDWATSEVEEKYIIESGDIIFSWSGTLILKIWDGEKCVLNQHLFKVTSQIFPDWFVFQWINIHMNDFIAVAKSKATTMGHIKRSHLDEAMCFVPRNIILEKYNSAFSSLMENFRINNKEIHTLTKLRDTLLPKLMSGDIQIKA